MSSIPPAPFDEAAADRFIEANAVALALPLDAANRDEIRANLLVAHRMAATILDGQASEHDEPLPVYTP